MPRADSIKFTSERATNGFISPFSDAPLPALYSCLPLRSGEEKVACTKCAITGRLTSQIQEIILQEAKIDPRIASAGVKETESIGPVPPFPTILPLPPVGAGSAYIGFTASTGFYDNWHLIHDFRFQSAHQMIDWAIVGGDINPPPGLTLLDEASMTYDLGRVNELVIILKGLNPVGVYPRQGGHGSAWCKYPIRFIDDYGLAIDWSMKFVFSMGGNNPLDGYRADGLTFCINANPEFTGGAAEGLGYAGIPNSIAVGFDTFLNPATNEPDSNHIEIDANGSVSGTSSGQSLVAHPVPMDSFDLCGSSPNDRLVWVWVDYNGADNEMQIFIAKNKFKPDVPELTYEIDLRDYILTTPAP
jgi:hypothetical protein